MKDESAIDFMINLAIDIEDFNWALDWVNIKYGTNNKAILYEDLKDGFGLLVGGVIKRFKQYNEAEFLEGTVVKLKHQYASRGDTVEYMSLNIYEKIYLLGYYKGKNSYGAYGGGMFGWGGD